MGDMPVTRQIPSWTSSLRADPVQELRQAIERSELSLHYQPVVNAWTGIHEGAEVLARWQVGQEVRSPESFVSLAEQTGLIGQLGRWVLRQTLRDVRDSFDRLGWRYASVNVSALELDHPAFADDVAALLAEFGLPPARLRFELTERVAAGPRAVASLHALSAMGIGVSLDDFGTGHAGLGSLSLPVDTLKLDRSYVTPLDSSGRSRAVVRALLSLARAHDLHTVAEGVETEAQARVLRELGCEAFQGFWCGPPQPLVVPGRD